jgi:hypothetical protein
MSAIMEILNKQIGNLSFKSIEEFCKEGHSENIQLDYKRDLSEKGLAKHFAAFSNSRGGIIIVGVEEDGDKGTPKRYAGIVNSEKLEDRVHQFAANVDPLPTYDIHITDEEAGKVFLLVRIYEGYNTPYYVLNDPNLYVRTGNITKLIDKASPEQAKILYAKGKLAELAKENNLNQVSRNYHAGLRRGEKERLRKILENNKKLKKEPDLKIAPTPKNELGADVVMLDTTLQPQYPSTNYIKPDEIFDKGREHRVRMGNYMNFPHLDFEQIPQGIMFFKWSPGGGIYCEQILSNGTIHMSNDVLRIGDQGNREIYISVMSSQIRLILEFAHKYLGDIGYGGGLVLNISVEKSRGSLLYPFNAVPFMDDPHKILHDSYNWEFFTDTIQIGTVKGRQKLHMEIAEYMSWDMGIKPNKKPNNWNKHLQKLGLKYIE